MSKRIVATVLWFLTAWYATAIVVALVGLSPAVGPFVGAAVGAFVAMDPLGRFWSRDVGTDRATRYVSTHATDRG